MSSLNIFAMSDLHGEFDKFQPSILNDWAAYSVDLIVCAGDMTNYGIKSMNNDLQGLKKLFLFWSQKTRVPVLFIAGNHDIGMKKWEADGSVNMTDRSIMFQPTDKPVTICGMSMSPVYYPEFAHIVTKWDNMTDSAEKEELYYNQFDYADIVISHCPPYGTLDEWDGRNIGSKELSKYIEKHQPKLVICGHVHEQGGQEAMIGKTRIVNVATTHKFISLDL